MKNLSLGQYYPAHSFFHRCDPRAKITALFLFYIFLFMLEGSVSYVFALIITALALFFSRVPLRVYWRGSRFMVIFIFLAAWLNALFTTGTTLWSYGFLTISAEGIAAAAYMAIRLIIIILLAFVLTFTTTPMAVTDGLEEMAKPLARKGVPIHEMALMMSIALRFIPTIMDEAEIIKKAQQSRGVDFNWRRPMVWLQNMMALLVPLFVSAFRRSEELALAMEARAYGNGGGRTMYRQLKLKAADWLLMGTCFFLLFAMVCYRWII